MRLPDPTPLEGYTRDAPYTSAESRPQNLSPTSATLACRTSAATSVDKPRDDAFNDVDLSSMPYGSVMPIAEQSRALRTTRRDQAASIMRARRIQPHNRREAVKQPLHHHTPDCRPRNRTESPHFSTRCLPPTQAKPRRAAQPSLPQTPPTATRSNKPPRRQTGPPR